jgi:hypothetical protein
MNEESSYDQFTGCGVYCQQSFIWHGCCIVAERIGIQLPRARRVAPSKSQRSRARSGQLQCRVGPLSPLFRASSSITVELRLCDMRARRAAPLASYPLVAMFFSKYLPQFGCLPSLSVKPYSSANLPELYTPPDFCATFGSPASAATARPT